MRFAVLAACLAVCGACTPADRLEIRFQSAAQQSASTELRVFAFGGPDHAAPGCAALDPRGLPPGDAAQRTGLTPQYAESGPAGAELTEIANITKGTYTVVIEGWGPPCQEVRSGADETVCARLQGTEATVLRGYYCNDLELGRRLDAAADLISFADIGATLSVPTKIRSVRHPDEAQPLLVTDGLPARERLWVQLLTGNGDEVDDMPVRFTVEAGSGSIVQPQPILTQPETILDVTDQGLAGATLQANAGASRVNDGVILVSAHAPGFEGSPVRFHARPLANVDLQLQTLTVPRASASMAGLEDEAVPVALSDLNSDGALDLITVAGGSDHQLLVHYGGHPEVHVSQVQPLQARALTVARLEAGVPSVIISTATRYSQIRGDTPHGNVHLAENPQLEIWSGLNEPAAQVSLTGPTHVLTQLDGQDIKKLTISITAADIDDDGVDELAMTRCSYTRDSLGSSSFIRCFGTLNARMDSEVAVLVATAANELSVRATIAASNTEGGVRESAFADIDDDGTLDLIFATNANVHGACSRRFQAANGFDLSRENSFFETTTSGRSYALATGHFNDDSRADVMIAAGVRAGSPDSEMKAVGGLSCGEFDPGPPYSLEVGSKTLSHLLIVRAADVNADGRDDVILLHRNTRQLQVWLGGGNLDFAAGPIIELPIGFAGDLAVATEGDTVVAATVSPDDNALLRLRFTPR